MKIVIISGSRADRNTLRAVEKSLVAQDTRWANLPETNYIINKFSPDLAIVHGDRHEIASTAVYLRMHGIPIAHIGGGERTRASYDDGFRDAITKMAHLHFVNTVEAKRRLVDDLSESESRVHVVGEPALDWLYNASLSSRIETMGRLGLDVDRCVNFVLVNWQPETLAEKPNLGLLAILAGVRMAGVPVVFISQNDDRGSDEARRMLREDGQQPLDLDRETYASALKHCNILIGNSSSGLIEAPVFGTPFLLVGDRQDGRLFPANVAKVAPDASMIAEAINASDRYKCGPVHNPYGDGYACERIVKVIGGLGAPRWLIDKRAVHS